MTSFWEGVYALAEAENFVPDQSWGGTSYQRSNSVGLGTLEAPAFFHAAAVGMFSQIAANQTATISRSEGKTELSIDGYGDLISFQDHPHPLGAWAQYTVATIVEFQVTSRAVLTVDLSGFYTVYVASHSNNITWNLATFSGRAPGHAQLVLDPLAPGDFYAIQTSSDVSVDGTIPATHVLQSWKGKFTIDERLRVALRAMEVTQSIQDWNNSVPLIAGKRTFVRAFLEAVDASDIGTKVSGVLRGYVGGGELAGSPVHASTDGFFVDPMTLAGDATVNRSPPVGSAKANSLLFMLPEAWTHGTVDLKFEPDELALDPREPAEPGGVASNGVVTVSFTPASRPRLHVAPIRIQRFRTISDGPSMSDLLFAVQTARRMYPSDDFDWELGEPIVIGSPIFQPSSSDLVSAVQSARTLRGVRDLVLGIVSQADLPPTSSGQIFGEASSDDTAAWACTDPQTIFAHELGHLLGRPHTVDSRLGLVTFYGFFTTKQGQCGEFADVSDPDFPFFSRVSDPCQHGSFAIRPTLGPMNGGENALIFGMNHSAPSSYEVKNPNSSFEIMSYCCPDFDRWISQPTYQAIRDSVQTRFGNPSPAPARALAQAAADWMVVRGVANLASNMVRWQPVVCVNGSEPPTVPAGDARLRFFDAGGAMLSEVPLIVALPQDFELSGSAEAPFHASAPFNPAVRRIELQVNGVVIGSLQASANSPAVQVLSPNGGETIDSPEFEISWQASDGDGDALKYAVQYSTDGGVNWRALATDIIETNLIVRVDELRGSTNALVRVVASDGFNCAADQSDGPFTIADKGPMVVLSQPQDGAEFFGAAPLPLDAMAMDREEGRLTGAAIQWRSDRDGLLGAGETVNLNSQNLSEGEHQITVTASDSTGHTNSVITHIVIGRYVRPELRVVSRSDDGQMILEAFGTAQTELTLEVSSDLREWNRWRTIMQSNATALIAEEIDPSAPARFYRARTGTLPPQTPALAAQSATVAVFPGKPLALSGAAGGAPPLSYQWYFNGDLLQGETNATLLFTNFQKSQFGSYFVVVSNTVGVVTGATTVVVNQFQMLHSFGPTNTDGINGWGKLTLGSDGLLYGCARNGGSNGAGGIFRIDVITSNYSVLHLFDGPNEGINPLGGVMEASDGKLYGTAFSGGTNNSGTIFRLNKDGSQFSVLRHFRSSSDCRNPQSEMVEGADGALYGTSYNGGGFARGGVFKIQKDGSGYTILTGFGKGVTDDPRQPIGGLLWGLDGRFYGTSESGGSSNKGAIFRMETNGNYSVIKSLGIVTGGAEQPNCTLIQGPNGLLFGTSGFGGTAGSGTVFRVETNGANFEVIFNFGDDPNLGLEPRAGLLLSPDGYLLGTTRIGGTANQGTIFRILWGGGGYQVLYSFSGVDGDGARSRGPLVYGNDGSLFGSTFGGGVNDQGVVFRLLMQ